MNVIVFGATGSIGKRAVAALLAEGHRVSAFARTPDRIGLAHPSLVLVQGDALRAEDVAGAIRGQDAVIVTLGAGLSRSSRVRSEGTLNVIRGMQANGVRRLICQTTLGTHESWDTLDFFWKRIMFGIVLRPAFRDHELQESLVRASGLDWTLVRPSAFTDGPATGTVRIGFGPGEPRLRLKIARDDVAVFLARLVADGGFLREAVAIST